MKYADQYIQAWSALITTTDRPSVRSVLFNYIIKGYFKTIFFNLATMKVPNTNTIIKKLKTFNFNK